MDHRAPESLLLAVRARANEHQLELPLVALGLLFLALQLSLLVTDLPGVLLLAKSLALGTILSTLALWILVPSRAR